MPDTMDLTGDGGLVKTVIRKAKADAVAPSGSLPIRPYRWYCFSSFSVIISYTRNQALFPDAILDRCHTKALLALVTHTEK